MKYHSFILYASHLEQPRLVNNPGLSLNFKLKLR